MNFKWIDPSANGGIDAVVGASDAVANAASQMRQSTRVAGFARLSTEGGICLAIFLPNSDDRATFEGSAEKALSEIIQSLGPCPAAQVPLSAKEYLESMKATSEVDDKPEATTEG